jgi:hypothetical protein
MATRSLSDLLNPDRGLQVFGFAAACWYFNRRRSRKGTIMKRDNSRKIFLAAFVAALLAGVGAQAESIWHSPLTAYTRSTPPIELILERGNHNALAVRARRVIVETDSQAVNIPLTVHAGELTSIKVCYKITTARRRSTYISRMTLSSMTSPPAQLTLLYDITHLWSTLPACYTSRPYRGAVTVAGALRLSLTTVFGSPNDVILIGAIEIKMDEPSLPPVMR